MIAGSVAVALTMCSTSAILSVTHGSFCISLYILEVERTSLHGVVYCLPTGKGR